MPDEELSDDGYSSIVEFKDKETLPQKHRIKKNRFREPYPSLFVKPISNTNTSYSRQFVCGRTARVTEKNSSKG